MIIVVIIYMFSRIIIYVNDIINYWSVLFDTFDRWWCVEPVGRSVGRLLTFSITDLTMMIRSMAKSLAFYMFKGIRSSLKSELCYFVDYMEN